MDAEGGECFSIRDVCEDVLWSTVSSPLSRGLHIEARLNIKNNNNNKTHHPNIFLDTALYKPGIRMVFVAPVDKRASLFIENSAIWGKWVAAGSHLLLSNTRVPGFKELKQEVSDAEAHISPPPMGTLIVLREITIRPWV